MMIDKNLRLKDKEKIILYMMKNYRRAKRQIEVEEMKGIIAEQSSGYKEKKILIHLVESSLKECSLDTQRILENEYFKRTVKMWYLEYYSKSTFYRLKHRAIEEFIDCLSL